MTVVTDDSLQTLIAMLLIGDDPIGAPVTAAGPRVFTPRTWRTSTDAMPILLVQSPDEMKQNVSGRNGPGEFFVIGEFRIDGRIYAKADVTDPTAAAMAAQAAIGVLKRQVEVALINADELRRAVQKFVSVRTQSDVKSEGGATFGEFVMTLTLEYYQGHDDFAPLAADVFDEVALYVDLVNLFSPTGDFTGAEPFAGTVAPRTSGPDGRPEAKVLETLPQDP